MNAADEAPKSATEALKTLAGMKARGEKIASLTAYDYPTARLLDDSGVDVVLVGDSLGMVVLGYPDTTAVTMDDMRHHTRAVARAVRRALVVADLPFATYTTPEQAVANARLLIEDGAHAVKLEGGRTHTAQIKAIHRSGIPVVAHLGMLPQSVREEGGYRIKGKTPESAEALMADALAIQEAGAVAVVLELVLPEVAERMSSALTIPTIGIGSGKGCDGQILVSHDLIGLFPWFVPKFVQPHAHVADEIRRAANEFVAETKATA
jgi:3-methyl-2-oxobutanoate hydroxymethyltransferase